VYNHHIRQLSDKLVELQHHYYHSILAATHVHLDHNLCAEVILIRLASRRSSPGAGRSRCGWSDRCASR
jgi:metal-responsive CopG/Arc/MetJ family transcriptional regulator